MGTRTDGARPDAELVGGRRSAQRLATRERLFAATVEEFKASGFDGTEIGTITDRVGVSRGTFYVHFTGKEQVLRELLLEEEHRIADATRRVADGDVPLEDVFQAIVGAVLRAERRLGRPLVRDLCAGQFMPGVARGLETDDHPVGRLLVGVLGRRIPETDAADLAMTFLTGLFGLLATDESPVSERRRRLDLLVRIATLGATST